MFDRGDFFLGRAFGVFFSVVFQFFFLVFFLFLFLVFFCDWLQSTWSSGI